MALKCKFKDHDDMEDHMLDQMIWGCSSSEAQKTLIGKDEKLRLNHAVSIVRNFEATQQHMQSLNSMNNSSSVNAVSRYTRGRNPHKFQESHDFRGPPKSHALENRDFRERSGSRERNYPPALREYRDNSQNFRDNSQNFRDFRQQGQGGRPRGRRGRGRRKWRSRSRSRFDQRNIHTTNRQETLKMEWNNLNNCHWILFRSTKWTLQNRIRINKYSLMWKYGNFRRKEYIMWDARLTQGLKVTSYLYLIFI